MRTECVVDLSGLYGRIEALSKPSVAKRVGDELVRRLSSYISEGASSRHKWAEKLGAKPTGMLEFQPAAGRSMSKTGATIEAEQANGGVEIVISGIMGIARAFGDLDIYPTKASALTVPIHKESYAKTVGDLEAEGWHIFRRGRTLVGNHGSTTAGRAVPLFILCGHVHIPQDEGLLPASDVFDSWAISEAEAALREAI